MKSQNISIQIEPSVPSIQNEINCFEYRLKMLIDDELISEGETFELLENEIKNKIDCGELTESEDLNLFARAVIKNESRLNIDISIYYWLCAKKYACDGNHDAHAWLALCNAERFYAQVQIYLAMRDAEEEARERRKANTKKSFKGGRARDEKYIPTRNEAARLLRDKKPAGGWTSKEEAIKAVSGEVLEFVRDNRVSLSKDNLNRVLSDWIGIPEVASAFLESKA